VVLETIVSEIDIGDLRVTASKPTNVEFRLFTALANCECFTRDICGLTRSILFDGIRRKGPCWGLIAVEASQERRRTDAVRLREDIISVSMQDLESLRIRGGTYVSEHSIPYHLALALAITWQRLRVRNLAGDTSHEMFNVA
jgi:hypothetical protein